jgi:hypothetical protein
MKKKRNNKPSKEMKPVFLVFCEGPSEETYIDFLRKKYRLPVKVIPHITGISISPGVLQRYIKAEQIGDKDTITSFLMYDLDVDIIAEKLAACKGSISIASNPTIELWYLLHIREQTATISTYNCIALLKKSDPAWASYKKGYLSETQKQQLWDNLVAASARAKQLPEGENPSSSVFRLIEAMEEVNSHEIQGK